MEDAVTLLDSEKHISKHRFDAYKIFKLLFKGVEILALSPALFADAGTPITILLFFLITFIMYGGWTCYLIQKYYKGKQVKHKTLQFWVLISRIFLIAPATIIGKYLGHFLAFDDCERGNLHHGHTHRVLHWNWGLCGTRSERRRWRKPLCLGELRRTRKRRWLTEHSRRFEIIWSRKDRRLDKRIRAPECRWWF